MKKTLEHNTIHHMDALKGMAMLPDKSIDMILCDLPYGTTKNKWDTIIPFASLWAEYERIIKDNGAIVLTSQQPFTARLVASNFKLFRYEWIWEKTSPTGHLNANRMPMKVHENILVFYKKLPTYHPQKTTGHPRKVSQAKHKINSVKSTNYNPHGLTSYDSTERYPRSVLTFPTDKQKEAIHPTQKPVALFEYLIRTYTKKGELVLDNCMGSGTTAIACEKTERQWIGFELDETYVSLANERLNKYQQQKDKQ